MIRQFKNWYRGPFVPGDDLGGGIVFMGSHRPTPVARSLRKLVTFWQKHWAVLIGLAIAFVGLIVKTKAG